MAKTSGGKEDKRGKSPRLQELNQIQLKQNRNMRAASLEQGEPVLKEEVIQVVVVELFLKTWLVVVVIGRGPWRKVAWLPLVQV